MKARLTFKLDVNNVREVGPYYTPMWDLIVNQGIVGEFWGHTNNDMVLRFIGRDGLKVIHSILERLQKTHK